MQKKRGVVFSISMEYAWSLYEKQNKKCVLSGLSLVFAKTKKGHSTGETSASLDRIDSKEGYVEGNVQWLHKWVNLMKSDFSQEEFIQYCKLIVEENEKKITSAI